MSLAGEAARFDRIILHSQSSNWVPQSVELFACKPVDNTEEKIFPSDHFGIRAVVVSTENLTPPLRAPLSLSKRREENLTPPLGAPLSLIRRREGNLTTPLSLTRRGEGEPLLCAGSPRCSKWRGEVINELKTITPVYQSAIVIIPPEDIFLAIQTIRQRYDARFERWMPHINLIYGFLPESYFDRAAEVITSAVAQIQPFTVTLNNFETFTHRKSSTAWLHPIPQPETALHQLQALLQSLFPQCNEQSRKSDAGFTPHLSVGQFSTPEEAFAKLPRWHPRSFTVKSIALISRRGNEPFEVRRIIDLGAEASDIIPFELINLVNQLQPKLNQAQQIQRHTVLEIVSQACKECLGFQPNLQLLGSYRLGVESSESDLDVVCQIPTYLSGEDFLKNLQQRLKGLCESIQLVLDAKVPLLRLKLEGISIDVLYTHILHHCDKPGFFTISQRDIHAFTNRNRVSLREIEQDAKYVYTSVDENGGLGINLKPSKSEMAIIGCWEADFLTEFVQEYVPFNSFQWLLRTVRAWAKSRRIYGNNWGFLGGLSWALLSAWSCQYCDKNHTQPDKLLANFFSRLNQHNWRQPIALTEAGKQYSLELPRDLLPIITSIEPCQNTARNITRSTAEILRREFARGTELTQEILAGNLDWSSLFEPIDLQQESDIILKLKVINHDKQELEKECGYLEGYIISLIIQLENNHIFVRPWTEIDKIDNTASIRLGLKIDLNLDLTLIEELARDFMLQYGHDFEVEIVEKL
ncbi:MAG: poly(A) polymerase [Cyanobacteria bacterium J06633_8]